MSVQGAPAWQDVRAVLRSLAMSYIGDSRAGGELRTKLIAIEKERAQALAEMPEREREFGSVSDRRLSEIEHVRRTIARSSAASSERLRALEAVIASVAADVMQLSPEARTAPEAVRPAPARAMPPAGQEAPAGADPQAPSDARPGDLPEAGADVVPEVAPDTRGEAWVRGGWSPPPPEDGPRNAGRLQ